MRAWWIPAVLAALFVSPALAGLSVRISTGVEARTYLDGQYIGDAPLTILNMGPGAHTIKVENPTDHTMQSQVVVSPHNVSVERELTFMGGLPGRTLLSSTSPGVAPAPAQTISPAAPYSVPGATQYAAQYAAPPAAPPAVQYVAPQPTVYYVQQPVYYSDPYYYDPYYYRSCSPYYYSPYYSGFGLSFGFGFGGHHHGGWGGHHGGWGGHHGWHHR